jgi:hypothetical protein
MTSENEFPDFIRRLPRPDADVTLGAYLSSGDRGLVMFYEATDSEVVVPEHVHGASPTSWWKRSSPCSLFRRFVVEATAHSSSPPPLGGGRRGRTEVRSQRGLRSRRWLLHRRADGLHDSVDRWDRHVFDGVGGRERDVWCSDSHDGTVEIPEGLVGHD